MALTRHPIMASTRVLLGLNVNPNDLFDSDVAITTNPTNFLCPRFRIDCDQRYDGWHAAVVIEQNAHEGTNISRYLGPGLYSSGMMRSATGGITNYVPGPGRRQIWIEISQTRANQNRDAEQEHCTDIVRAYTITLDAVQTALQHAVGNPAGAQMTRAAAMTAARNVITGGLHARLQAIIDGVVDVNNATVDNDQLRTDLTQIYLATCALSNTGRDGHGYHTFVPAGVESQSMWSWLEWGSRTVLPSYHHRALFGDQKDIRELVTGPHFQVPGPASAAVIQL